MDPKNQFQKRHSTSAAIWKTTGEYKLTSCSPPSIYTSQSIRINWPSFLSHPFSGEKNVSFREGTWRIIPVSKWLITTIYKPFKPFGRGPTTLLRGRKLTMVINHLQVMGPDPPSHGIFFCHVCLEICGPLPRSDDTTTGEPMELETTEMPTDSFEPMGTTQEMRLRTASDRLVKPPAILRG